MCCSFRFAYSKIHSTMCARLRQIVDRVRRRHSHSIFCWFWRDCTLFWCFIVIALHVLSLRERSHNVCLFEKVHEYIRAVTACKRMCVYVIQWISFYILAIKIPGARIILALSERVCLCAWAQWEWEKRVNFCIWMNGNPVYIVACIYVLGCMWNDPFCHHLFFLYFSTFM